MKTSIIISETMGLKPLQRDLIVEAYGLDIDEIDIPAEGWSQDEIGQAVKKMEGRVIFVSPDPVVLKEVALNAGRGNPVKEVLILTEDADNWYFA